MNKARLFYFPGILFIIFLIGVTGCKQTVNSPQQDTLTEPDLAVFDMTDAFSGIQDATLNSPIFFDSPLGHPNFFRGNFEPGRSGRHLFRILKSLDLSESQKSDVKSFMADYKSCADSVVKEFKDAIKPILDDANAKRQAIIDSVKNGLKTKDDARIEIHNLNISTREQIKNDPAVLSIQLDLCDCKNKLFNNIASILDADQKAKWDNWVAKLPGLCTGD